MTAQRLKLLFYVEHFQFHAGGLEANAVRLCAALAARGHAVHVLAEDADLVPEVAVHADGLAARAALAARVQPDLTIDWGFYHPADVHRLGGGTHRGFLRYHLDAYRGLSRWLKQLSYHGPKHRRVIARELPLLRHPAARFIANSQLTATLAIADGADPARVTVRHNGVDTQRYHPERCLAARPALRAQWGLAPDGVAFLLVAHNLRLKNLDLLLRVFAGLPRERQAKLIVAGKRRPGVQAPWLVYAGQTDDLATFYAAADALVHPTYFDSCANVVLEAMSTARPVVISDTCGVNELVTDGRDGRVLGVRGPAAAVEAAWRAEIETLARDPGLRQARGQAARVVAEANDFRQYVAWFDDYLLAVHAARAGTPSGPAALPGA